MNSSTSWQPYRNCLLSSLPEPELKRLCPHLSPVVLRRNQTLFDAGQRVETVYFLEGGVCSILAATRDGNTVEVGLVGREGFIGCPAVLGTGRSSCRCVMQLAGSGYSIKAKVLEDLCSAEPGELRLGLLRAVQALLAQTAQLSVCNRVHQLDERLARWLLMCQDRMQIDSLLVTHESLAMLLGTCRSTVTLALGTLQKTGSIAVSRGHVQITSRAMLEQIACDCYSTLREDHIRMGRL